MQASATVPYLLALCITLASWEVMGEVVNGGAVPNFLLAYIVHSSYVIVLPLYLVCVGIDRRNSARHAAPHRPTKRFVVTTVLVTPLLVAGGYTWYVSLQHTLVSANNAVFQSNVAVAAAFEVAFCGHALSWRSAVAIATMLVGVGLVALDSHFSPAPPGNDGPTPTVWGYVICVLSVTCYAAYEVIFGALQRQSEAASSSLGVHADAGNAKCATGGGGGGGENDTDVVESDIETSFETSLDGAEDASAALVATHIEASGDTHHRGGGGKDSARASPSLLHTAMDSLLFLSVHGLASALSGWIPLLLLDWANVEVLAVPHRSALETIAITAIGDTCFNAALLFGVAVSSASQMAGGNVLIVPLGFGVDFVLKHEVPHALTAIGSVVICCGFLAMHPVPQVVQDFFLRCRTRKEVVEMQDAREEEDATQSFAGREGAAAVVKYT